MRATSVPQSAVPDVMAEISCKKISSDRQCHRHSAQPYTANTEVRTPATLLQTHGRAR
ncbi:hypothetical protein BaRGS_00019052, partial [Batillaria attramentaria]